MTYTTSSRVRLVFLVRGNICFLRQNIFCQMKSAGIFHRR